MAENSLIKETSPYLLQHAHNPVNWYAWNDDTLKMAKKQDKPIFLSIGYSSCHWCHVMAHECFENNDIAHVMNENFINIKVDREERPDLDDIYQKSCQIATGQGGWPLSVFLTPNQRPFYVGTYFPPYDHYGRPGFGSILRRLSQAWRENRKDVEKTADNFLTTLQKTESVSLQTTLEKSVLDEAAVNLIQIGDPVFGGFGSAPKFPNAANISFLFRYSQLSGISKFQEFALLTLKKMASGGIFDQIGGGFHRYSTDSKWLVPHFEKMLYDNALIPINYVEAFQITKDPLYLEVLQKTLDYVIRDMTSEEGGFYSAQDADSEGEEGKYYVWTKKEITQILGSDANIFCLFYDVTDGGNWEGKSILCNNIKISTVAFNFGKTESEIRQILSRCSDKLLSKRNKRIPPGLDDKILTSWNALMVSALAKGYKVTNNKKYLNAAIKCIDFIETNLFDGTKLMRTYKNGIAKIDGYLEDYAYFVNALLDIFEVCPDEKYLINAKNLMDYLIAHFWNDDNQNFYMTADVHESLIIRPASNYDLSIPSGNSVAAHGLFRLYVITQNKRFFDMAREILASHAQMAAENPFGFGYLLNCIFLYLKKPLEITLINPTDPAISNFVKQCFIPESSLVIVSNKNQLNQLNKYPYFSGKIFSEDNATVYVCRNSVCSLPLNTITEVEKYLDTS